VWEKDWYSHNSIRPFEKQNLFIKVEQKKTAKGIVKSVVKKELKYSNYVECILEQKNIMCQQNLIRSKRHNLHVVKVNKVGLFAFDDKRFV